MMNSHRIVVSAENTPYAAWQAKLFCYSCLRHLEEPPLIIVHESGRELHTDFHAIIKAGGAVQTVPNYRTTPHGDDYFPRNTAGTLRHAAETCNGQSEFIVLCDPDMIFVRRPDFPLTLAGDFYAYMNYDREVIDIAAHAIGVTREMIEAQKRQLRCGVPYVIPVSEAGRLAELWLEAIDAFPPRRWEDSMYAFGLAVAKMNLRLTLTRLADHNYRPDQRVEREMIHYCYGNEVWSKRDFLTDADARRVWRPPTTAREATIAWEIFRQLEEAREFYDRLG
jgi:hypothetical protein